MSVESVVNIPVSPEEMQRRLMVEVHRLAGLATADWTFQLQSRAGYFTERFGRSSAEMKALILARLKDVEKAKAEEARIEQRAERAKEKAEREAKKNTERKAKEKAKALSDTARLPRDERDDRIIELAESCGEDVAAMQQECSAMVLSRTPSGMGCRGVGRASRDGGAVGSRS
jgi:hypothetical protein